MARSIEVSSLIRTIGYRFAAACAVVLFIAPCQHLVFAQCFGGFQFPPSTVVPQDDGSITTISSFSFAGDRARISLLAGRTYRFTSSIPTDHITVSTDAASGAQVFGTTPVFFTATASQDHFVHFHTNAACGTQNANRITQVRRDYCQAGTTSCGFADERIVLFSTGTIHNESGEFCDPGGYSDFTHQSTVVSAGMEIPWTLVNDMLFPGGQLVSVSVDWNRNFSFFDNDEIFFDEGDDGNFTFYGTIHVPLDVTPGPVRMRVRLGFLTTANVLPCGITTYGEVEDYTLIVVSPNGIFAGGDGRGDVATLYQNDPIPSAIFAGGDGRGDIAVPHLIEPIPSAIFAGGDGRGDIAVPYLIEPIPSAIFSGGDGRGDIAVSYVLPIQLPVSARAYLEGPYNSSTGLMDDALRTLPDFPLVEPYTTLGYGHSGGGGGETIDASVLAVAGDKAVVDWVLLELRAANDPSQVVASRSALVLRDGFVVDTDGVSNVGFNLQPGQYHIAILHRNHLGVMRGIASDMSGTPASANFASAFTQVFGTGARKFISGNFAAHVLWAGDVNFDGVIKYTGADNDRDPILTKVGGTVPTATAAGYHQEDVNLDGAVRYTGSSNDRDVVLQNVGGSVPTAVRVEQLP